VSALRSGDNKAALKLAKSGIKRHRKAPEFANFAGIALCNLGKHQESVPYFQKAAVIAPSFVEARRNLAQTLVTLGRLVKAEKLLRGVLASSPRDTEAMYIQAQLHYARGDLSEAEQVLTSALKLNPADAKTLGLRATIRTEIGMEMEALEDFRTAISIAPWQVETLVNASLPLARQSFHIESQAVIDRALGQAPDHVRANLRNASLHQEAGRQEDAADVYRKVLETAPHQPEALTGLVSLLPPQDAAGFEPIVKAAMQHVDKASDDRARLHFALARIAKCKGDAARQLDELKSANGVLASLYPYDTNKEEEYASALTKRFQACTRDGSDQNRHPRPVFILGLPRSGTSLTEAVLSAHPEVAALGERAAAAYIFEPYADGRKPFDADDQVRTAEEYYTRLPALPSGTTAFTDKMPENYKYVGFLVRAIPNCRIICLHRDPRDTAISLWEAQFSGAALSYAYDFSRMAHQFNQFARLSRHWQTVFPNHILPLRYEDMASNIEETSRRIAEFAGLSWIPEMARPHQTGQKVLTLSANQLREKVHSRSVGKWQRNAEMLTAFTAELDSELWPEILSSKSG
jgi:tetratricopeptide (TPR) repeat protein